MSNTFQDLELISGVPASTLENLFTKILEPYICNQVREAKMKDESIATIDLGFCKLHIKIDGDLKYKIVPSTDLASKLDMTVHSDRDEFKILLSKGLKKQFEDLYKELC